MSDIVLRSWCPHSLPNEWPLLLPSHTSLHPWELLVTHLLHHNFSGIFNPLNLLNMFANLSIYVPFQCHHCTSSSHHHYLPLEFHNCLLTFKSASPFALVSHFPPSSKMIPLESDLEHSLLYIKTSTVCWGKNKNYGKPTWLCHPTCLHLTPYLIPPAASIPALETSHSSWRSGSGGSLS